MNDKEQLNSLKTKTGVNDFDSVSNEQFENIQVLAGEGKISKKEMESLVEAIPNFIQLQETYIDGLKATINSAKETQKDALRGITITIENLTKLLQSIVEKSETEELRSKIVDISLKLAENGLEIAKILQETNKENNNLWKSIAGVAATTLVVVGSIFIASKKES
ncbi:MAG: hypothetical protein PHS65_06895 [Arcobacteraceae bacterium]|nr:hypothetical protein [Arcobacteraceae bacterium]